jgi:ankyrin repeat protein
VLGTTRREVMVDITGTGTSTPDITDATGMTASTTTNDARIEIVKVFQPPEIPKEVQAVQAIAAGHEPAKPLKSLYDESAATFADNGQLSSADDDEDLFAKINWKTDSINDVDENGETLLTRNAAAGSYKVVKSYIKAGANTNYTNRKGYTALMLAVERGLFLTSTELVRAGTDLAIRSATGMTAMLIAVSNNYVDIAQHIADHGGNVNDALPQTKITALMMAAQKGHIETVDLLIAKGANVNAESKTKESALLFAVVNSNTVASMKIIASLVAARAHIDHANKQGLTALMLATSRKYIDTVQYLLNVGASVNQKNEFGMNAMDIAFENDDEEIMKILRGKGGKQGIRNG